MGLHFKNTMNQNVEHGNYIDLINLFRVCDDKLDSHLECSTIVFYGLSIEIQIDLITQNIISDIQLEIKKRFP